MVFYYPIAMTSDLLFYVSLFFDTADALHAFGPKFHQNGL